MGLVRHGMPRAIPRGPRPLWLKNDPGGGPRSLSVQSIQYEKISSNQLGLKTLKTTGSISASSNSLVLSSDPGFSIGDYVIVELGGEATGGLRGTVGVGGAFPFLSYIDLPALDADTGQPDGTFARLVSTADVYISESGVWIKWPATAYYQNKTMPLSLNAKVTGKSGNTLTLDTAAVVGSTNANVYFDNWYLLQGLFNTIPSPYVNPVEFTFTDMYAVGGPRITAPSFLVLGHRTNWIIQGLDKDTCGIYSPMGTVSAMLEIDHCTGCAVRNVNITGNSKADGYGLIIFGNTVYSIPVGLLFSRCLNCVAYRVKAVNCLESIQTTFSTNVWIDSCEVVLTEPIQSYTQNQTILADSVGGGIINCAVNSTWLIGGFEFFRSHGGLMKNLSTINGTIAFNSAGNYTVQDVSLIIQGNSQYSTNSFNEFNPMCSINSNIQPPDPEIGLGGTISNLVMVQQGYINSNNDSLQGIVVNIDNPNITVVGGSYTAPDYSAPSALFGACGVQSQGSNTIVNGICVHGTSNQFSNIDIYGGGSGTIENCYADTIRGGTQINNHPASECPN